MKSRYRYALFLTSLVLAVPAKAQNWQPKGALYEDKNVRVEIEYNVGNDPCTPNAARAGFRYHVTRSDHAPLRKKFYIAWRFDYFNCDHELRSQFNTLTVSPITPAYVTPENNSFPALQIVNHISYTNVSQQFPRNDDNYRPASTNSIEPRNIEGRRQINAGETTLLTLKGGYLASGANWKWYENDCNGAPVGTGSTLNVQPAQTTKYFVRAEGKVNTPCVSFEVKVVGAIVEAPSGISGPTDICSGTPVTLSVSGGKLSPNMHWAWSQGQPGGSLVGEGTTIQVTPLNTTTYYVRGEGTDGQTISRAWTIKVRPGPSPADGITGPTEATPRSYQTYSLKSTGILTSGLWVWYQVTNGRYYRIGTGTVVRIQLPPESTIIAVRAESSCGNSAYTELPVTVGHAILKPTTQPAPWAESSKVSKGNPAGPLFFVNGGVVANDPSNLKKVSNYEATIGGGNKFGWYFRVKFDTDPAQAAYETSSGQILNYDQPGYYTYTGGHIAKHTAYTGGLFIGSHSIAVYLGGGYGQYLSLYEIGKYKYDNSYSGSAYVSDLSAKQTGAEFEGGLLLRVSYFNLMGGVATFNGKYTDFHAGIGFNF